MLLRAHLNRTRIMRNSKGALMTKKISNTQITKEQLYRAVASSTAIETGASVEKIEQQLKRSQKRAKSVGLAR